MKFRNDDQPVINVQISMDEAWAIWFHANEHAKVLAAGGLICIAEEAMEMADKFCAIYDDLYAQHQIEKQLASA